MVPTFFCIFNFTGQWESPCYQTLNQYQVAGLGMALIFLFLFCHPTIRVAVLLEFETISSCWPCYGTVFFSIFNLTEQWGSPRCGTLKNIRLLEFVCYWNSFSFFCHCKIRFAVLLAFETISSCWTCCGTDISFPFLSAHYQSRRAIRLWNNNNLLDLVWYWLVFESFLTSPNNGIRLVDRH